MPYGQPGWDPNGCNCNLCIAGRLAQQKQAYQIAKQQFLSQGVGGSYSGRIEPMPPQQIIYRIPPEFGKDIFEIKNLMHDYLVLLCFVKEETNNRDMWLKVKEQIPIVIQAQDKLYDMMDKASRDGQNRQILPNPT